MRGLRHSRGISIHPPRVGWDIMGFGAVLGQSNFNPPTPCGVGRQGRAGRYCGPHFNPPTPCGVGLLASLHHDQRLEFQSTHPVWGGTQPLQLAAIAPSISIHPPRVGWDLPDGSVFCHMCGFQSTHPVWGGTAPGDPGCRTAPHFNPPTPCGVGRRSLRGRLCRLGFQSTHPVWGGTSSLFRFLLISLYFNPPTPCGVGP